MRNLYADRVHEIAAVSCPVQADDKLWIAAQNRSLPIGPAETAPLIQDRLAELGAGLLQRTVVDWVAGRITPRPQPAEGVTYARKIEKEDGRLDWQRDATDLGNRFRAFLPWPGTFTQLTVGGRPRLLKIWDLTPEPAVTGSPGMVVSADQHGIVVACQSGGLRIRELQLEGSRRMPAGQFLAGHPLPPGTLLG